MARIGRKEIAYAIKVAFNTGTKEGNEDAACLIIIFLLNTNLLESSAGKLPWSLANNCNSITNINQYNWAKETTRYLMELINRAHKRKKDKQPTFSGTVVLLLVSKQKLIKTKKKFLCYFPLDTNP